MKKQQSKNGTVGAYKENQLAHQWKCFRDRADDLNRLKSKYDELLEKVLEALIVCPPQCIRYYLRFIAFRTFYVIERCKLLQNGKCYRKYQCEEEADYLLSETSDRKKSFDEDENKSTKNIIPPVQRLSLRSVDGIRYIKADVTEIQRTTLSNIARDIDQTLLQTYAAFESDIVGVLHAKEGINHNYVFKCRQHFMIDVKFKVDYYNKHKHNIPPHHIVKGEQVPGGITIWCTSESKDFYCYTNKWENLILDGVFPCPVNEYGEMSFDHESALKDAEATSRSTNNKANAKVHKAVVDSDEIGATNARLGLGSRLVKHRSATSTSAFLNHTPDAADRLTAEISQFTPLASGDATEGDMSNVDDKNSVNTDTSPVITGKRHLKRRNVYSTVDINDWQLTDDEDNVGRSSAQASRSTNKRRRTAKPVDDDEFESAVDCRPVELHKNNASEAKKKNRQNLLHSTITKRVNDTGTWHACELLSLFYCCLTLFLSLFHRQWRNQSGTIQEVKSGFWSRFHC